MSTGMHQGLIPIHTTLIDQTGWTVLLPVLAMGGAGQIGACIALWVRFRSNASLVRTIRGALPAGFLCVGEPLIYGVTLPLGRPFIPACIGGAFGGGVVGLFDQLGHSVGAIAIGASDLSLILLLNGSSGYGWALRSRGAVVSAVRGPRGSARPARRDGRVGRSDRGYLALIARSSTSRSTADPFTDHRSDPRPNGRQARIGAWRPGKQTTLVGGTWAASVGETQRPNSPCVVSCTAEGNGSPSSGP